MRSLGRSNIFILCFARFVICAHDSLASLTNSAINVTLKESDQNITDGINPTLEEPMKLKEETPRVDIKEVFRSVCARQVDVLCIKLSLILLVDRLASRPSSVEIYPGVSIQQGHPNSTATTPGRFLVKTAVDSPEALDEVVLSSIHDYLRSLSLNIHILDNNQLRKFRRFGEEALPTLITNQHQNTGRGKNKGYGGVAMAGLITGGSMLALALSGLAAMAGKAMMTALMAMMMALICLLKGHGGGGGGGGSGGGKSSHYEVIAHPYFSKEQTHSAEFQTDQGAIYHAHAHGVARAFELNQTENRNGEGFQPGYQPSGWGALQGQPFKTQHERLYDFEDSHRRNEVPGDEILAAML